MVSSRPGAQGEQIGAALLWALGAAFMASILLALPKLGGSGVHPFQITFYRYVTAVAILLLIWMYRLAFSRPTISGGDGEELKSWTWLHILRAILATARITCIFTAISIIPLANVQAILLTNGVFVTLFAGLLLREYIPAIAIVLGLTCLGGGLLASAPDFSSGTNWQLGGAALAFLAAIMFGLEAIIIKFSSTRDSNFRILMAVNLAALVFASVPAALVWTPMTVSPMLVLLGMGPVALIIQTCNLEAFRRARASMIVPVRYTGVIFATLMGFVIFGEIPTIPAFLGMAVIAISGTLLAWMTSPNRKTPPNRPLI
ncbi:MAG: DMT family transporter [Fimbriimonadaceae bacterium]|nr:DMT family transporter [Alphaproteobacteria bacterium]